MARAGRKPLGPHLVEHLEGTPRAKQRLEAILETIAGRLTIDQACESLGIAPAMFYRLRMEVLQVGLAHLEPRPLGRPPHQATAAEVRSAELTRRVAELESELHLAGVREEIASTLSAVPHGDASGKKTSRPRRRKR